jgi:glycosyltransferase involved in cell wall biosynthesis
MPSRLTIAHVTGETGFSGGEVQVFLLIGELARRGHANVLVCPPGSRSEREARRLGVPVEPVAMRSSVSAPAVLRAIAALRRCAPDLVHLHTGRANWVGGLAARYLSLPAITTRRMDRKVSGGLRTRWLYRRGVRHAVAISGAVRQRLLDAGVPAGRTSVIPSAVDPQALRAPRARGDIRRELGLGEGDFCLLALTALERRKGLDVLLDAVALLETPPRVLIAGDGPCRAELEARCERLGLTGRVRFLGHREDTACLLAACDALVLPSRAEGLGVAALEAMACARPVVASRVGGLAELVHDGATGLLVPPGDPEALARAIAALGKDAALCQRLGEAGAAEVAERHLPAHMGGAYEALYLRVLGADAA